MTIIGSIGFMLSNQRLDNALSWCLSRRFPFWWRAYRKTFAMFRLQSKRAAAQTAFINGVITNQKGRARIRTQGEHGESDTIKRRAARVKATLLSPLTNPPRAVRNSVVYAAVALIGAFLAVTGQGFTIGMLSCFLSYANQYTKPFNEISGVITELQKRARLRRPPAWFLDSEEMPADPELLPEHSETAKDRSRSITFASPIQKTAPLDSQFQLGCTAGCRIAIVGPTGCGKTTMINLLMRFYDPDSGSVGVDGTNTQTIPRRALRRSFGMVRRETWLKTGTVLDNVRMGRPDASEEDVIAAAKAAHARIVLLSSCRAATIR
ncbi:ATP-binding cassette domain-containing protein [Hominenteromicrobium sp.]|uniref:ATP-binding cassette domain-containing protein n=1 Tax=Hominenteromicrobium sp. TaxID=3073581 RepID=UPI00399A4E2C